MDSGCAKEFFNCILGDTPPVSCKIWFWDGAELSFGVKPQFVLHLKRPDVLDSLFTGDPSLAFGKAYVKSEIDIEGDLGALLSLMYRTDIQSKLSFGQKAHICWTGIKNRVSGISQSRRDVQIHYDKGNDFYRLWLDEGLNYSCALFSSSEDTLEEAQRRKIAYSLHKLRLSASQRLLEIGCGWGSLAIYAAKTYGCSVVGLTLSEQQYELGRKRVEECGLSGQVDIRLEDYRELSEKELSSFDRIVSIGMFEHVGRENILVFFKKVACFLRQDGLILLHTIGRTRPEEMDPWITTYIFPGSYIPSAGEIMDAAELCGLDFIDMEDLRHHYDLTLGHWIRRFETNVSTVKEMMGEQFVRMWRLYLNGSQMAFRYGPMHVFQFFYSLGRRDDLPLTRRWFYETEV